MAEATTTIFDPQFLVIIIPAIITGAAGIIHALNSRKAVEAATGGGSSSGNIPIISKRGADNLESIKTSIVSIETSVGKIETKIGVVEKSITQIETGLNYVNKELAETQEDVEAHEKQDTAEFRNMDKRISILEDRRGRKGGGLPHP